MTKHTLTFEQIENLEERILNQLGAEEFLMNLIKAMDIDQREDLYKYIARCWDIPYTEEEEQ